MSLGFHRTARASDQGTLDNASALAQACPEDGCKPCNSLDAHVAVMPFVVIVLPRLVPPTKAFDLGPPER
jgi:hypothetical protein